MDRRLVYFMKNEKVLLFVILSIFLSLSLSCIDLPVIDGDETRPAIWTYYMLRHYPSLQMIRPYGIPSYSIFIGNKFFPIMRNRYVSATKSYLLLPFFLLLDMNVFSLRLLPVSISALTLIIIYYLCREWFGKRMAIITTFLTATHAAYIIYSKTGIVREEIFQIFCLWMGFLLFWFYFKKRKNLYLYGGFFVFGLGLNMKIMFLYYLVGLLTAYLPLRKQFFSGFTMNLRQLISGLVSFCIGAIFLIFYNIISRGETIKLMCRVLINPTYKGFNNLAYLNNLMTRMQHLFLVLTARIEDLGDLHLWRPCFDYFSYFLFVAGLIFLPALLFLKKTSLMRYKDKIFFLYILYTVVFLLTPFTVDYSLSPAHTSLVFPFPQIVISLFLCALIDMFPRTKITLYTIIIALLVPLFINGKLIISLYSHLKKGKPTATYELADYLKKNKISNPLIADNGDRGDLCNVVFLSKSEVIPVNPAEEDVKEFIKNCSNDSYGYLVTLPEVNKYDPEKIEFYNFISKLISEYKKKTRLIKLFYINNDVPAYALYEIAGK